MKKLTIIGICLAVFVAAALAAVYDENNFSAGGRMYQPLPKGYKIGKDNAPGIGTHHLGEDCGVCHRAGGRAEKYLWTMSGTLYQDRSGSSVVRGGEILMQDRQGNVISMTSNRAGNFWTTAPIASDPYTVKNFHGHEPFEPMYVEDSDGNLIEPADPDNAKTWHYKTWVRNRKGIRHMLTIGAVGGNETYNRMSCNMHHSGFNSRGALWDSNKATLPSYPARSLSYRKHIYPILRSKCAPCHIPGKRKTSVNTKTDLPEFGDDSTSIDYSGGLDLMTYEGSIVAVPKLGADGNPIPGVTEEIEKIGVTEVVNTDSPKNSTLLLKTVYGGTLHAGGFFWSKRSADYKAIRKWIAEGALKN